MKQNTNILAFDVGQSIIGIRKVHNGKYIPYYGEKRIHAINRLENADEIVSYNGNRYDIKEINNLSNQIRQKPFSLKGKHTDMIEIIWPGILGSSLSDTYNKYFGVIKSFPDTYEGDNQRDVYMTIQLWKYWKNGGKFNV